MHKNYEIVTINLLDNKKKHTPSNSQVTSNVHKSQDLM